MTFLVHTAQTTAGYIIVSGHSFEGDELIPMTQEEISRIARCLQMAIMSEQMRRLYGEAGIDDYKIQ